MTYHPNTLTRALVGLVCLASVWLFAGCSHPKSECADDDDCHHLETCQNIGQRGDDTPVRYAESHLRTPLSSAMLPHDEDDGSVTVTITRRALLVDDETVAELPIESGQREDGERPKELELLRESLKAAAEQRKQEQKLMGRSYEGTLAIVADTSTSHRLLARVVDTAEPVGLDSFQFVVRRGVSPWNVVERDNEEGS